MPSVDDAHAAVAGRVAVEVIAALDDDETTLCSPIHCHGHGVLPQVDSLHAGVCHPAGCTRQGCLGDVCVQ